MAFDQTLLSTAKSFPAFLSASTDADTDAKTDNAVAAFEDRLWSAAEAIIAAGAPSLGAVAEAASLVRRHADDFASLVSGANHMRSLGEDAALGCDDGLNEDITRAEDRLLNKLREDLSDL